MSALKDLDFLVTVVGDSFERQLRDAGFAQTNLSHGEVFLVLMAAQRRLRREITDDEIHSDQLREILIPADFDIARAVSRHHCDRVAAFEQMYEQIKSGVTEKDIKEQLEHARKQLEAGIISHDINALADFDLSRTENPEKIGEDIIHEHTQALLREWEDSEISFLPDERVQRLLVGANRLLQIALHIDLAATRLKIHATKIMEVALAGGPHQALLRNITASLLPQIPVDHSEPPVYHYVEEEEPEEGVVDEDKDSEARAPAPASAGASTSSAPTDQGQSSGKKRSKDDMMPDVCDPYNATQLFPRHPVPASLTRIDEAHLSPRIMDLKGQSYYKCHFNGKPCRSEIMSSKDGICSHIRRKHLGISIACLHCQKHPTGFFRGQSWTEHMQKVHPDIHKDDWKLSQDAAAGFGGKQADDDMDT